MFDPKWIFLNGIKMFWYSLNEHMNGNDKFHAFPTLCTFVARKHLKSYVLTSSFVRRFSHFLLVFTLTELLFTRVLLVFSRVRWSVIGVHWCSHSCGVLD